MSQIVKLEKRPEYKWGENDSLWKKLNKKVAKINCVNKYGDIITIISWLIIARK